MSAERSSSSSTCLAPCCGAPSRSPSSGSPAVKIPSTTTRRRSARNAPCTAPTSRCPQNDLTQEPSRCGSNAASSTTSALAATPGWCPPCAAAGTPTRWEGSTQRSAACELSVPRCSLDDACRFRVLKTDDPLASFEDALDRRFIGEQGSG